MSSSGAFQPSFRITNRMTAGLMRIERARGLLQAAKLSEDWLAWMRSRALLLEAASHHAHRGHAADAGTARTVAGG